VLLAWYHDPVLEDPYGAERWPCFPVSDKS
jgi:hypothetical protein